MGLFDNSDVPKPGIVNLDPGTQDLINNAYTRSAQSSGDLAKETFNPASDLANQSVTPQAGIQSEEMRKGGLMDPNMISAIRSKQGSMLGQRLTGIKQNTELNAFNQRSERLKFAQNAMIARQKIENSNYERLVAATNNENEIRANVLKGWMALGGAVVGGAVGGPMGAMAGSQLGGKQTEPSMIGGDVSMPPGGRSYSGGVTQNDFMGSGYGNSPSYSRG